MERYFKRKCPSPENSVATQESACGNGISRVIQPSNVQPEPNKLDYRTRLGEFVECIKLMLGHGIPLYGPFWDARRREKDFVSVVKLLDFTLNPNGVLPINAGERLPEANAKTQEGLFRAATKETTRAIVEDLGGDFFGVHVAGFYDVEKRRSIAVVLRYVDKEGIVKERLIGFLKATQFSGSSYKADLDSLLSEHVISSSRIRGLSYDGDCSFRNDFNELKNLIVEENRSAYHTHCSTKQLHSTLIAALEEHVYIICCGEAISDILNLVWAPCKPNDEFEKKEKEAARILLAFTNSEPSPEELVKISSKIANTRWKFNYELVQKLLDLFSSVRDVLDIVHFEGVCTEQRVKAGSLLRSLESFDFVFGLHFAVNVLGITNELSMALEKEDRDVASVVTLVQVCKEQLQVMRAEGWESFLAEVSSFCQKHEIPVPNMDQNRYRKNPGVTNLHEYRDRAFYWGIDSQLEVLNDLFCEVNIELLLCASCLNPSNSFHAFDMPKLLKLAQFYPNESSVFDRMSLKFELENYIVTVRSDKRLSNLNSLGDLSRMLVKTGYHDYFPLVYWLLKLALLLPINAPTDSMEEKTASSMKLIETKLKEQISDPFMNDCLVTYVETDILDGIQSDAIVDRFLT